MPPSLAQQRDNEKRQARKLYPSLVETVASGEAIDQAELRNTLAVIELDTGDFQESVRREKIRQQIANARTLAGRHSEKADELSGQRNVVERRMSERQARFETVQAEYQNLMDKDTEALADVAAREKSERELADVLNRQADERKRDLANQPPQRSGVPKANSLPV